MRRSIQLIHAVVHQKHGLRHVRVAFDERLQRLAHHPTRQVCYPRNIDRQLRHRKRLQLPHPIADHPCRVADALHVRVDLDHRQNKPQVDGHRLLHRQQVQRHLIDFPFQTIDRHLSAIHKIADGKIAHPIRLHRALDRLLGHPRHHQQLFLQIVQVLLESDSHYPNLPVM